MNKTTQLVGAIATLCLTGNLMSAITLGQSIGVDIGNADGSTANWTPITAFGAAVPALDLSNGTVITGVTANFTSSTGSTFINNLSNTVDTNSITNAPQNVLTDGGGAFGGTVLNTITLAFAGLDPLLKYDLEIYSLGTSPTADTLAINGVATPWPAGLGNRNARRLQTTGVIYSGLSADAANALSFSITHNNNPVLSAVRLTAVPEPSSAALLGLGALALVLRRRK